jgi:lipopolysaccharide/colanic/teichoic acid biosynthesis glycosyltransferase
MDRQSQYIRRMVFKRSLDLLLSGLLLILLSPLLLLIAVLVKLKLGSPILFRQIRPGLNARTFQLIKFRSMATPTAGAAIPERDHQRLTSLGTFLRRTSLDELPQLWNVLRGEMSLVGPRPLLVEYLPLYSEQQARRHEVLPGMTGWAQAKGRNGLSWEEKFQLDVWYVDHWSLGLDLWILLLTLYKVTRSEGVNHPECATMVPFNSQDATGGSRE